VKKSGPVLKTAAVLLTVALLIGGGGITLIMHTCQMCNISTVKTLSILNPSSGQDICCGGANNDENSDKTISSGCCDYRIEQFNVNNFVVSSCFTPEIVADQFFSSTPVLQPRFTDQSPKPVYTLNKHGGRFIVNANCQFLS
jgi:hypothetical protein